MADDPIQIVVTDGVAKTIEPTLTGIATSADAADTATAALNAQMTKFGGIGGQATISAKEFAAALLATGNNLAAITPEIITMAQGQLLATDSLRGYTQAQIELFRAQQEGLTFQQTLNESFGITAAAGDAMSVSARQSAAAFSELLGAAEALAAAEAEVITLTRGLTDAQIAQYQAAQDGAIFMEDLNASFGLNATVTKSAADSAAVFTAAMNEEIAAAAEAAASMEALGASTVETSAAAREGSGVWGGFIGTLAAFFAIKEVVSAVDDYTRLTNALKQAGLSGQQLEDTFAQVTDIAERNGASVNSLASIYQKLAIVQSNTGLSQNNLVSVTNEIAESFRVQGINAQQAYNAMRDLGDIADLTTVKWANFYRLQQADPALVRAAAEGLGVSLQELDAQVQAHTLTTQAFFQGILKGADAMQALTDKTHLTITGALNDLNTSFVKLVDQANAGTGALYLIAQGIQLLAENLPLVVTLVLAFGSAWALVKLSELTLALYGLIEGLVVYATAMAPVVVETLAAAAPFIVMALAVAAIGTAILLVTGQMDNFVNNLKTIGNAAVSALGIDKIPDAIRSLTGELNSNVSSQLNFAAANDNVEAAVTKAKTGVSGLTGALNDNTLASGKSSSALTVLGQDANGADVYLQKLNSSVQEITSSIGELSASTETASSRLAALQKYQSAGGNFSDSYNDNGNFTTIGNQTSFPDISGPTNSDNAFATGGSFYINGRGGTDTNQVRFRATTGERVDVLTPAQQATQAAALAGGSRGPTQINVHIYANDVDSFQRSKAQVSRQIGEAVQAGSMNG